MQMSNLREIMPTQSAKERIKNFNEVALGYTKEQAVKEAKKCIQCKKPKCIEGCPVEIDIPNFIGLIAKEDFKGAILKIKEKNNLPAVCGRVCPQESQCEILCLLGKKGAPVAIGRLERFVADFEEEEIEKEISFSEIKSNNKKIAVIGSGPSGLTCAADLSKMGYSVTIFEGLHATGGVLRYGIPEFRLPKSIVDKEIDYIKKLGVEIKVNMVIGLTGKISDLFNQGYVAVFIGTGAGLPYFLGISGENLNGIYSANEFLTRTNLMCAYKFPEYATPIKVGKKVAVVGAGNVAMDAARCALRLGASEVHIVYRRSKQEMPARIEEIEHAEEEGIIFDLLTNPMKIIGNEKGLVCAMECIKMELGEPDSSGRRKPIPIKGSEFIMEMDTVIPALGQGPNPLLLKATTGLELNKWGNIVADENGKTSLKGVYAGGDIVTGAATVISAMGAGKKASKAIHEYLQ
ncbi:MAG: NADPH-dependent glutamate synthase [bacterium]